VDASEILAELLTPEGRENPYPHYAASHELGDVLPLGDGLWLVPGYEAINQTLRSSAFGPWDDRYPRPFTSDEWKLHPSVASLTHSILDTNPPDHTRMRDVLARAFTARRVAALEPMIAQLTSELLDSMAEAGKDGASFDFMDLFAFRLSVGVVCELFGMPREDWPKFRKLGADWTEVFEVAPTEESTVIADAAYLQFEEYFTDLVAKRRADPGDDLVSAVVQITDRENAPLTAEELVCNLAVVLAAGYETATHLFGNGLNLLFQYPEVAAGLRAKELAMDNFVEEILRFDSPVQLIARVSREDGAEIAGAQVPPGEWAVLMLGAGNRDPARYTDPDRFDPTRTSIQPVSLGAGIHHCLGAPLARLEGSIVFAQLLERFPGIAPAGPPTRRDRLTMRGYETMPVILNGAPPQHQSAASSGQAQATTAPAAAEEGSAGTIDGTWAISYQPPVGKEQHADLILAADGTKMTGTFDGFTIDNGEVHDSEFTYTANLTAPFKVKVKCTGSFDGDTMSGKVKAAFMSVSFTGTRKA
jgi:cytochrome P450